METKHRLLQFVFLGYERNREVLEGAEPAPPGKVHVCFSLPGKVVAVGSTKERSIENLQRTLEWHFRESGSATIWYEVARENLTAKEKELIGEGVVHGEDIGSFGRDEKVNAFVHEIEPDERLLACATGS